MRNFIVALTFFFVSTAASAQTICGVYQPFNRSVTFGTAVETVGFYTSCQSPDPATWSHTYQFKFPSILTYYNGEVLAYVGGPMASVSGVKVTCYRCVHREVDVNAASVTDSSGNVVAVTGMPGPGAWIVTGALAPDTVYSFAVSGTSTASLYAYDLLMISAQYWDCIQDPSFAGCPPLVPPPLSDD